MSSAGPASVQFKVHSRDWGDNKRLDLVSNPDGYKAWHDRAIDHLSLLGQRPDVWRLLIWAEEQDTPITVDRESTGATGSLKNGAAVNLLEGPNGAGCVAHVLYSAIKYTCSDSLLGKIKSCGQGR